MSTGETPVPPCRNCLAMGQLHALMYRDLAAHFEQVNILYLSGNHGRRTQRQSRRSL